MPNFFCALVIYSFTGTSKKQLSKMSIKIPSPTASNKNVIFRMLERVSKLPDSIDSPVFSMEGYNVQFSMEALLFTPCTHPYRRMEDLEEGDFHPTQ